MEEVLVLCQAVAALIDIVPFLADEHQVYCGCRQMAVAFSMTLLAALANAGIEGTAQTFV